MAGVAQLVRASVCGTEGRGFKSRQSPLSFLPDRSRDWASTLIEPVSRFDSLWSIDLSYVTDIFGD